MALLDANRPCRVFSSLYSLVFPLSSFPSSYLVLEWVDWIYEYQAFGSIEID